MRIIPKISLLILIIFLPIIGKESEENQTIQQLKIGNFALPPAQQPGPLIAFGQNMLDKGNLLVFNYVSYLHGVDKNFVTTTPSLLYAFTDDASIFIELPIAAKLDQNNRSSHGLQDPLIQGEYAFFNKNTLTTATMLTAVANITLPAGSALSSPPTGFGAPSFFLGLTANYVWTDWYIFTSYGATLTTTHDSTKFGNQFLYQWGLIKNIRYTPDEWIFDGILELDGIYKQRDTIRQSIDKNSGGNQLLLTPSLWFSTQHLTIQGGISWIIAQHLFGTQNKDRYAIVCNFGWKF